LDAKLFAGPHQAGAEELLPETVGDHTSRERVLGADEPLGEVEARTRSRCNGWAWQLMERGRHALGDFVAEVEEVAAELDARLAPFRALELLHDRHSGERFGVGELLLSVLQA